MDMQGSVVYHGTINSSLDFYNYLSPDSNLDVLLVLWSSCEGPV